MENKLKRLFDYQKFEGNADLQRIINATHARYGARELNLDEMSMVSAAGIPGTAPMKKPSDKDRK